MESRASAEMELIRIRRRDAHFYLFNIFSHCGKFPDAVAHHLRQWFEFSQGGILKPGQTRGRPKKKTSKNKPRANNLIRKMTKRAVFRVKQNKKNTRNNNNNNRKNNNNNRNNNNNGNNNNGNNNNVKKNKKNKKSKKQKGFLESLF